MIKRIIISFMFVLAFHLGNIGDIFIQSTNAATAPVVVQSQDAYQLVDAMDVVKYPSRYLNRKIKIDAIFDKFSVVGLDYKPAFRSSEDYILFLIRKTEVEGHIIPLSEMKIFIKRDEAEKYVDLEAGDKIQFTGKVFSNALGEPWIEVDCLTVKDKIKSEKELSSKLKPDVINKK